MADRFDCEMIEFTLSFLILSTSLIIICSLTVTSRTFYERTKFKQTLSISFFALGIMLLGFCSYSAGKLSAVIFGD